MEYIEAPSRGSIRCNTVKPQNWSVCQQWPGHFIGSIHDIEVPSIYWRSVRQVIPGRHTPSCLRSLIQLRVQLSHCCTNAFSKVRRLDPNVLTCWAPWIKTRTTDEGSLQIRLLNRQRAFFIDCSIILILREHDIGYHLFADDNNLYLEFSLLDNTKGAEAMKRMASWVAMARSWKRRNMLRLNSEKADNWLPSAPDQCPQHRLPYSITIGNAQAEAVNAAQNVGAMFDSVKTFELHPPNLCRSAYCHQYTAFLVCTGISANSVPDSLSMP